MKHSLEYACLIIVDWLSKCSIQSTFPTCNIRYADDDRYYNVGYFVPFASAQKDFCGVVTKSFGGTSVTKSTNSLDIFREQLEMIKDPLEKKSFIADCLKTNLKCLLDPNQEIDPQTRDDEIAGRWLPEDE